MARLIFDPELIKLRAPGQWSQLSMAVHTPAAVYSARVNQTFTTFDQVTQITFTPGADNLANVLPGMTMYVSSIAAGGYEKGVVRIRKTPDATTFYIGETSDIAWANNDYLTVVNEFGLWAKHIYIDSSNVSFMDWDVAYTNQHEIFAPVPVLGPIAAVLRLTGATVTFSPTAAASWVFGGTVTYSWSAPGASATSNLTTATPTITYNAAGTYRVSCTVTSSNGTGNTATGYRWVFVNPTSPSFALEDCSGDYESGYWSFTVTCYAGATLTSIRDRAMVTLWARDFYNGTEGSIGPVAGYENVICTGWIDGETVEWNPQAGSVKFTVRGPGYWMGQIPGFPTGLEYSTSAPTAWTSLEGLTTDRALWHLFHWRSTVDAILDVILTGDTRKAYILQAPAASLWEQVNTLANQTILARAVCDRYGRLFVAIDEQYISVGSRAAVTVMALTKPDWVDRIDIPRHILGTCANVDASGVTYDGSISTPLFSKASGNTFRHFGRLEKSDQLLLADQTSLNELAGLILAQKNNEYPNVDITLTGNNRMIDIAPAQCVTLTLAAGDTPRGISFTDKKLYPRRVEYRLEQGTGYLSCSVEFEAETSGPAGVTVIPPVPGTVNIPPNAPMPPLDPFTSPWIPTQPGEIPPGEGPGVPADNCPVDGVANGPFNLYMGGVIQASNGPVVGWLPCKVRSSSHTYKTTYLIQGTFYKKVDGDWVETSDDAFYDFYALDSSGYKLLTATHDAVTNSHQRTGYFTPPAATNVSGFMLEIVGTTIGTVTSVDALRHNTDNSTSALADPTVSTLAAGYRIQWHGTYHSHGADPDGDGIIFQLHDSDAHQPWLMRIYSYWSQSGLTIFETQIMPGIIEVTGGMGQQWTFTNDVHNYSPALNLTTEADWHALPYDMSQPAWTHTPSTPEIFPRFYIAENGYNATERNQTFNIDIGIFGDDLYKIVINNLLIYNICSHD